MTMFPAAQNPSSSNKNTYHGGFGSSKFSGLSNINDQFRLGYEGCGTTTENYYSCLRSDLVLANRPMAEDDESRLTESTTAATNELAGSSSKEFIQDDDNDDNDDKDEGWLQLSIGGRHHLTQPPPADARDNKLVELDLLPAGGGDRGGGGGGYSQQQQQQQVMMRSLANPVFHQMPDFRATPARPLTSCFTSVVNYSSSSAPNLLFQQYPPATPIFPHPHDQDHTSSNYWGLIRPPAAMSRNMTASSSSSSLSTLVQPPAAGYYSGPSLQLRAGRVDGPAAGPSLDFRVVDPPRRPHSGIWFMLQASQNQAKEPFLPQIPKSYLRIKDGRMTVRLVMKYLVNKLRLDSESEIEITCRGQQLLPFLTLQHVRDNVWTTTTTARSEREIGGGGGGGVMNNLNIPLQHQPSSTTTTTTTTTDPHHLMLLHYGWSSAATTTTTPPA